MNQIAVKNIVSYGQTIPALYIDNTPLDIILQNATSNDYFKGLWSAWLPLGGGAEEKYIWRLLNEQVNCNLPLLLCPDDMDFWCTVIVAQVRYTNATVTFEKIGEVTGEYHIPAWRTSGICDLDKWTPQMQKTYSHVLGTLSPYGENEEDDKVWENWWSKNWTLEEYLRTENYIHQFFNNPKNIEWTLTSPYSFSKDQFESCVKVFNNYK